MSDMTTDLSTPAPPSPRGPVIPVGAVMHPPVTIVEVDAHLAGAAYLMKHNNTKALLVVADDDPTQLSSILTVSDIAHAIADGRDPETTRVSELDTASPMTVERTVSVTDAARQMVANGIEHLPVVDDGRLVGIVDLADLSRPALGLDG